MSSSKIFVTGKVFFDLDEDGVQDTPVMSTDEVGVEGFRVQLLKNGCIEDTDTTDSLGCYSLEVYVPYDYEEEEEEPKYEIRILGPTGVEGVFGFVGDGVVGANWFLTNPPSTFCIVDIYAPSPGRDFGVLSYGEVVEGAVAPNLTVEGEDFWCDQKNKRMVLGILEACDPDWRVLLNDFCLQFSCLTNQFGAKNGLLVFKTNNALPSALNLLCRFFEKENCGDHMMHQLSEDVALVLLSSLCILDGANERILILQDGVFVELTALADATRNLLCDDRAVDPFQDPSFLASVQNCINEWDDAVDDGVFGRSGEPLEVDYGESPQAP